MKLLQLFFHNLDKICNKNILALTVTTHEVRLMLGVDVLEIFSVLATKSRPCKHVMRAQVYTAASVCNAGLCLHFATHSSLDSIPRLLSQRWWGTVLYSWRFQRCRDFHWLTYFASHALCNAESLMHTAEPLMHNMFLCMCIYTRIYVFDAKAYFS